MNDQPFHLAFCCDQNVADGLVTGIASVATRLRPDCSLEIHVIDCGLAAETRERISRTVQRWPGTRVEFIPLHPDRLKGFPPPAELKHVTLATYGRLFLHELLSHVERMVYLDCDLLVTCDLFELFQTPLNDRPFAAVRDELIRTVGDTRESLSRNLPELRSDEAYFNSGVLLLDLKRLRDLDATRAYNQALRSVEASFGDQSVLNAVFHGQWKALPERWNRQIKLGREFNVFPNQPNAIWHFTSTLKPWHFQRQGSHGLLKQWQDQRDAIGWAPTFKPTERVNPSIFRDLLKQGRSWLECSRSEPTA